MDDEMQMARLNFGDALSTLVETMLRRVNDSDQAYGATLMKALRAGCYLNLNTSFGLTGAVTCTLSLTSDVTGQSAAIGQIDFENFQQSAH